MGKGIMFFIFVGLSILLAGGLAFPDSPAMWLASSDNLFTYLRIALLVLLGSLLVTRPPRNVYFRMFVGMVSTGLGLWALHGTYANEIQLLDGLSIVGACISMGIVALEFNPEESFDQLAEQNRSRTAGKGQAAAA